MTNNSDKTGAVAADATDGVEFLTFTLGDEEFGVAMQAVQELRGVGELTPLASAPAFVRGRLALAQQNMLAIDLRLRFDMPACEYDEFTVLIVLKVGARTMAVIADRVTDVVAVSWANIKPLMRLGSSIAVDYMLGIGTVHERSVILLDAGKFMLSCEAALPPALLSDGSSLR